jgi:hypothetical protein
MAKRTTLYVAFAVLIIVAVIATFLSRNIEKFAGTPTGVQWCYTPTSCTTRANPTLQPDNKIPQTIKSLKVYPGYQAQTSTTAKCEKKGRVYNARDAPYEINDPKIKCIYSGRVSTATSA